MITSFLSGCIGSFVGGVAVLLIVRLLERLKLRKREIVALAQFKEYEKEFFARLRSYTNSEGK